MYFDLIDQAQKIDDIIQRLHEVKDFIRAAYLTIDGEGGYETLKDASHDLRILEKEVQQIIDELYGSNRNERIFGR